jgi:hypothetical protein
MAPYVQIYEPQLDEGEEPVKSDEPMYECTECEYVGSVTEFIPENYR